MADQENRWIDRAFFALLSDAIEHAYLADTLDNPGSVVRLARSAIINCALSVECAANVCLGTLALSSRFLNNAERMGTLDKYELFLMLSRGERIFDRGCREVQKIQDIINLRNDFLHPKELTYPVTADNSNRQLTVHCGSYRHLKIDQNYRTWRAEAATIVLKAVSEFFDRLFIEWCGWTSENTIKVLCPSLILGGTSSPALPKGEGDLSYFRKAQSLWGIDFAFVGIDGQQDDQSGH